MVLLSVIVLALSNIDIFSRFHVISSDRRAKLQNDISFALDHMTKIVAQAVGSFNDPAVKAYDDNKGIRVRIDNNPANGRPDTTDTWVAYRHENTGASSTDSEIRYYPNAGQTETPAGSYEIIARKVIPSSDDFYGLEFSSSAGFDGAGWLHDNALNVRITSCWNPAPAGITFPPDDSPPLGNSDNPCVTMSSILYMRSVSTN